MRVNALGYNKLTQLEQIEVESDIIECDGGGPPLGHPMVYLKLTPQKDMHNNFVTCPYCSRQFFVKSNPSSTLSL
jgi:uncharacterized Zn-finger protein